MSVVPTRIASLSFDPLDLPLVEPFAIAGGAPEVAANVLVRIQLEDGTLGLGEAAPLTSVSGETQASTMEALRSIAPAVVGRSASGWLALGASLENERAPAARCAVEMAALDALCRHHRISVGTLFGGAATELQTDMTITAGSADHAARSAKAIVERGIATIKIKIGAASPKSDAERLVRVREAAPDAALLVDANGGYTPAQASEFLGLLERANVVLKLFEQPVPRSSFEQLGEMRARFRVPICADESARSAQDVMELGQRRLCEAVNIKLMKSGIVEALRMWHLSRAFGLKIMIGGMVESILAMSFSAQFSLGLGGADFADLDTPMFIAKHPFMGGWSQTGGRISIAGIQAGHGVILRAM